MGNSSRKYLNRILNNFTTRFRIYAKRAVGVRHFYMLKCSQKHIGELVLNKLAVFRLATYHKPTCSTRKHAVGNAKAKEINKLLRLLTSYLTGCNIFFVEFYKVSVGSAKSIEPKKIRKEEMNALDCFKETLSRLCGNLFHCFGHSDKLTATLPYCPFGKHGRIFRIAICKINKRLQLIDTALTKLTALDHRKICIHKFGTRFKLF